MMHRHYNHDSGHKILELPAPNNKKITIPEFIKYLLDTRKTICQGPQDPNGQPGQPVLEPLPEGAEHTQARGLLPLAPVDKLVRMQTVAPLSWSRSRQLARFLPQAQPMVSLGSYEGCSFVCSSLRPGER